MRLTAIACFALSAHAAQASDVALDLAWPDAAVLSEIVAVTRDSGGSVLNSMRMTTPAETRATILSLPSLSRQATTLQVAALVDGEIRLQSPRAEVTGGEPPERLRLDGLHATGFATDYLCETGAVVTLVPDGDGFTLTMANGTQRFAPTGLDAAFVAEDGARATRIPGLLELGGADGALQSICQPIPTRPLLPLSALGSDGTWQVSISSDGSAITTPQTAPVAPGVPPVRVPASVARDADDLLVFQLGDQRLALRNAPCRLPWSDMPYPFRAEFQGPRPDAPLQSGCAGNPLHALEGRPWQVSHIFGLTVPSGADGSTAFTLQFDTGQLTGRTSCNRYLGRARTEDGRLVLHDLGTTRLPCPANLRNLETRYLDALETATGFVPLSGGRLALYAGSMAVLIAKR